MRSKNPTRAKIQRLRDKCDQLWSQYIRKRDQQCIMCGATENLQAHHAIVTKGSSSAARYEFTNGITLCYKCHIHGVHGSHTSFEWLENYMAKIKTLISEEERDRLRQLTLVRTNIDFYEGEYERMIKAYQKLEQYDRML